MALPLDAAIFLVFIGIVVFVVWNDRKNVKPAGLVLMRRTKQGREWLYRTARRWPRAWKALSTVGVIVAIPAMVYVCYFIISNAMRLATGHLAGAVKLVLPWSSFAEAPGLFLVPWYFWVLGIAVVIIPHELFHGIACRIGKISVKSLGWMLFLFVPGAFVDPDVRDLARASRVAKLRVYAAGSFANLATGLVCIIIWMVLLGAFFTQAGVIPSAIVADGPWHTANVSGTAILQINNFSTISQEDYVAVMQSIPPGSSVSIETTSGNYTLTTVASNETSGSDIGTVGPYSPYYRINAAARPFYDPISFLVTLFSWLFTITVGIGIFNLLPIKPLDGGLIFEEIAGKFLHKNATRMATMGVSLLMVALVVYSIVGPVIMTQS